MRKTEGPFCKSSGVDRQEIFLTRVRLIWAVGFRSGDQDWIRRFGAALDAGSSRLRRRAAVSSPDLAGNGRPGTVSCAASPGRKRRRRGTWLRGPRGATTRRRASSAARGSRGCSGEPSRAREHTRERENKARRGFITRRSFGDGWTSRMGDGMARRRWPELNKL